VAQGTVVNKQGMATQALIINRDGVLSGTLVAPAESEEEAEPAGDDSENDGGDQA
jgi:hypothetical protein